MVVVIARGPLAEHFLVVIEEVRINFLQHPRLPHQRRLEEDEGGRADPVNECAGWPLVREWQVEELENAEKAAESVHIPVLVVFRDASAEVVVVQQGRSNGQNKIRVRLVQVRKPEHACTGQISVFETDFSYRQDHDDKDG